jgi:hypothetical protein
MRVSLDHGLGAEVTRRSLVERPSRLLSLHGKMVSAGAYLLAVLVLIGVALFKTSRKAGRDRRFSTPTRGPPPPPPPEQLPALRVGWLPL